MLTGGCLCGGVRYELTEAPLAAGYCHCKRCQRRSGTAASANASVRPEALRVTQGEELVRSYQPEDGAAKEFCSACGSALWSRHAQTGAIGLRLGTLDEDPGVELSYHQFVAYAAPWEPLPDDGLPRYDERRPT